MQSTATATMKVTARRPPVLETEKYMRTYEDGLTKAAAPTRNPNPCYPPVQLHLFNGLSGLF